MADSSELTDSSLVVLVDLVDDSPRGRRSLASAFKRWARSESAFRVLFTPEVFIAVDYEGRRGYLYDDGWSVECWLGRGAVDFLELLEIEFAWNSRRGFEFSTREETLEALIESAFERGSPINEVRHLL